MVAYLDGWRTWPCSECGNHCFPAPGTTCYWCQELRKRGDAVPLSNGDPAPFVKWPEEDYAYVEGRLEQVWEGTYGPVARISVHRASDNAEGVIGSGDERYRTVIKPGNEVNLGLQYAGLKGLAESQIGKVVHVAFTGWGETREGNRFRRFEVFRIDEPGGDVAPADQEDLIRGDSESDSPVPKPDDDLPF